MHIQENNCEYDVLIRIFDTISAVVAIIDADGRMVRLNHYGQSLIEYSLEEIAATPYFWKRFIPVAHQAQVEQVFARAKAGNMAQRYTNAWISRSGREHMLEWSNITLKNTDGSMRYLATIGINITEKENARLQMLYQKEKYETLFRISRDGIAVLDLQTNFLDFNDTYLNMTGFSREALLTKSCLGLSFPDDFEKATEALKIVFEQGALDHFEKRCVVKDNKVVTVSMSIALLPSKDKLLITTRDISEQKTAHQRIEYLALHDPLIGLPNRIMAKQTAEQLLQKAMTDNAQVAVLYIDLDGFKAINDTLGHDVGDEVLKITAARIQKSIRSNGTLCRQGGDEFLVLLPETDAKTYAESTAAAILQALDASIEVNEHLLTISASIGVSYYPQHGKTFEALLQHSDMAMYHAKSNGKNGYAIYNHQIDHQLGRKFRIQQDIKAAIQQQQFVLYYQPQLDLNSNRVIGVEALVRWHHPEMGTISPLDFIPIAESTGLIIPLGEWILHEACQQIAKWQAKGIFLSMAINISSVQFKRGNLEAVVRQAIQDAGVQSSQIELELTESIMIHDTEKTLQTVHNLKAFGVQLSIDDFGTGYSSLTYLKRFAVDKLKIDQSFVANMLKSKEDAIIVNTIIQMAKNLGLKTIAEGVEGENTLELLKAYGCDEVQGYHFAKPMAAHDFEAYFIKTTKSLKQ